MANKLTRADTLWSWRMLVATAVLVTALPPGLKADDGKWFDVEFSRDSPVLQVSFGLRPTTAHVLGSSMALDLHASLLLRNVSSKTISGLTLRVEAQDLTPSGRGSVTVPNVDAKPGEVFPVRIDLQLTRPFSVGQADAALVRVSLDCALFGDLTAYGPDQLHSRRSLVVYEMQARRDRQHMATLLSAGRLSEIREELNFGLQDSYQPYMGLELLRNLPHVAGTTVPVRTMPFGSSPVVPMHGLAQVAGNEIRDPRLEVRNTSRKDVSSIEVGWLVRDERGREFMAGLLPSLMQLGPVQSSVATSPGVFRLSPGAGQALSIAALTAFVSDVEFADGKLWIPSRSDIDSATEDPLLRRALTNSPEEQRLAEIYRHRGINGLTEDLHKHN